MMEWHRFNHLPALATGLAPCVVCARPTPFTVEPLAAEPHVRLRVGTLCAACGAVARESHEWLLLCLPEARRFWREHPRIRFAGTRFVEAEGLSALVTAHESVDGGARIEVVAAADTLRILSVHRR